MTKNQTKNKGLRQRLNKTDPATSQEKASIVPTQNVEHRFWPKTNPSFSKSNPSFSKSIYFILKAAEGFLNFYARSNILKSFIMSIVRKDIELYWKLMIFEVLLYGSCVNLVMLMYGREKFVQFCFSLFVLHHLCWWLHFVLLWCTH